MSDIKPCPFCGAENPRSDSHADDCYFTLHRALNNAPEADLSLTFAVIDAWNRRANREQMPERQKEALASEYFSEEYAASKALRLIDFVERYHGIRP